MPLNQLRSAELERKSLNVEGLRAKLAFLRQDFESKLNSQVTLDSQLQREETIIKEAQKSIKVTERDEESKNLNFRQQITRLRADLAAKTKDHENVSNEYTSLQNQYKDVSKHYQKLHDEAKHLIYAVERKEHDINILRSKLECTNMDNFSSNNQTIAKLEKDLVESRSEFEKMKEMWMQSQKDLLKFKSKVQELEDKNIILETRRSIAETVVDKAEKTLSLSKNEEFEQKMESAKLYSELKRLKPIVSELQLQNVLCA